MSSNYTTSTSTSTSTTATSNTNNTQQSTTRKKSPYNHCYLLQSSQNTKKTYIGYTTNPQRRIKQHNGILKGGARQTSSIRHRPWNMICVIGGFQSDVGGLKFEWAWQNPMKSTIFRSGFEQEQEQQSKDDGDDDNHNDHNDEGYDDAINYNNTNQGSNRALIEMVLNSCGKTGLRRQLTALMILLCECSNYKEQKLTIYFFKKEHEFIFRSLFRQKNDDGANAANGGGEVDDDDEFAHWCERLPPQMNCQTISSFDVMPFLVNKKKPQNKKRKKLTQKKKKRKQNNEVDVDANANADTDVELNVPMGAEFQINRERDDGYDVHDESDIDHHNNDEIELLHDIQNLSIIGEEENQQQVQQHRQQERGQRNDKLTYQENETENVEESVIDLVDDSDHDSDHNQEETFDFHFDIAMNANVCNNAHDNTNANANDRDDLLIESYSSSDSSDSDETIDLTTYDTNKQNHHLNEPQKLTYQHEAAESQPHDLVIVETVDLTSSSSSSSSSSPSSSSPSSSTSSPTSYQKKRNFCYYASDSSDDNTIDLCSP